MKKFLFVIAILTLNLLGADFNMPEVRSKIISIDNSSARITSSPNLKIGSGGVVMHTFKNGDRSIIARAVVDKINGNEAIIKFQVFSMLEQNALPLPNITPSVGDDVILNFLYNRSLIVVPNKEVYNQVVSAFPNITFINPDITAAFLDFKDKPNPSRDDFRKMCDQNIAGLIFLALDKKSMFLDCKNFKVLKEFPSGSINYYEVPFYSNIKDIKEAFYDFSNKKITNYNSYYTNLINE